MLIQQTNWQALKGKAYGLTMPTLVGTININTDIDVDLTAINSFIANTTSLTIDVPIFSDQTQQSKARNLVEILLFWLHQIQQQARQPLFEHGQIIGVQASTQTVTGVQLALPYVRARATIDALSWLITTINTLNNTKNSEELSKHQTLATKTCGRLISKLQRLSPSGSNTLRFLKAAHTLGMPWSNVADNVFEFGYGINLRWLDSSFTDQTSVIGARFARNKQLTANALRKAGLPVPQHFPVNSADTAVKFAQRLGFPVVIKPMDKDRGLGVAANLKTPEEVCNAFYSARKVSRKILVEKHIEGQDYRLTVFNGKMIWAILRMPGGVIGNGKDTVASLVETLNDDPLRDRHIHSPLKTLHLNDEAKTLLAEVKLTESDVPKKGQFIRLRRTSNISTGGTPTAATNVHPDNQRLAENAARALKLDLAGIDLIIPDISQSWLHTESAICEVNAQPQLGATTNAEIYAEVLSSLVSNNGRIPIVLIIGDQTAIQIAKQLQILWQTSGKKIAIASNQGLWFNDTQIARADTVLNTSKAALNTSTVEAIIAVSSTAEIEKTGLAFDHCDVVIITDYNNRQPSMTKCYQMVLSHNIKTVITSEEQIVDYAKKLNVSHIKLVSESDTDASNSLIEKLSLAAAQELAIPVQQ
ncbi:MAG: cyanophycin synthetase [Gammaproteobacteria bacterium]|nr:MAG: cyanophycin synthetase [Gammaproteobacteria bacterium]